jgi:hypothetical protein
MEKLSDERLISIRNDGEAGGTFAAADVLSMIGEIIYSRKRIAELLNAYYKLEADARISQEFQRDVLMPLFDQLEKAGFSGMWSQKVAAVLNPWIAVSERLPGIMDVVLGIDPDECWQITYRTKQGEWWANIGGWRIVTITHWMPLPLPPESEGK